MIYVYVRACGKDLICVFQDLCMKERLWDGKREARTFLESISFHLNPKEDNAKECSNYHTISLISQASKVMFKILRGRLQQYMSCELPDIQDCFRKGRGTRDQIANIRWIIKKARVQ